MQYEVIDLYKYFHQPRREARAGKLTAYVHEKIRCQGLRRRRPAILVLPGGSYKFVSPYEAEPVALYYFQKGFNAFVLDYDVLPHTYPYTLEQAAMAMMYIRKTAQETDTLENCVAAVGFSAGGHLLGCISVLTDDPAIRRLFGDEWKKVRPDASVYGYAVVYDDHEGEGPVDSIDNFCNGKLDRKEYQYDDKVSSACSPAFIWTTSDDNSVPVSNSVRLYEAYVSAGVAAELHIFREGNHGLSVCGPEVQRSTQHSDLLAHVGKWLDLSVEFLSSCGLEMQIEQAEE